MILLKSHQLLFRAPAEYRRVSLSVISLFLTTTALTSISSASSLYSSSVPSFVVHATTQTHHHHSYYNKQQQQQQQRSTTTSVMGTTKRATTETTTATRSSPATTWEDGRNDATNRCIIPLSAESHKGSSGRVGVLGGSARYTGAPYYAAMASLKAGADLAYVFCAQEAALPIKSYSPELMVAPVYSATQFDALVASATKDNNKEDENNNNNEKDALVEEMVNQVTPMMGALHSLVIGPGLGRCPLVFEATAKIIQHAISINLSLVIDADALYMLSLPKYRSLLEGYRKVVLTPNVVEYKRLFPPTSSSTCNTTSSSNDDNDSSPTQQFREATIVQKGYHDIISVGRNNNDADNDENGTPPLLLKCEEIGGLKRSGGIGDVLAGTLGTLVAWNEILNKKKSNVNATELQLSCWTGCCFVKRATKIAFGKKRRSMTAPDVLEELGTAIDIMTRDDDDKEETDNVVDDVPSKL